MISPPIRYFAAAAAATSYAAAVATPCPRFERPRYARSGGARVRVQDSAICGEEAGSVGKEI